MQIIQRQLETKVGRTLIAGDVSEGTRIIVDLVSGDLDVTVQQPK